jgi:hypothetical protein
METTHHQHNCDAQMTTLLRESRNGVRSLVLHYALHQTPVVSVNAVGRLLAQRTASGWRRACHVNDELGFGCGKRRDNQTMRKRQERRGSIQAIHRSRAPCHKATVERIDESLSEQPPRCRSKRAHFFWWSATILLTFTKGTRNGDVLYSFIVEQVLTW